MKKGTRVCVWDAKKGLKKGAFGRVISAKPLKVKMDTGEIVEGEKYTFREMPAESLPAPQTTSLRAVFSWSAEQNPFSGLVIFPRAGILKTKTAYFPVIGRIRINGRFVVGYTWDYALGECAEEHEALQILKTNLGTLVSEESEMLRFRDVRNQQMLARENLEMGVDEEF